MTNSAQPNEFDFYAASYRADDDLDNEKCY